MRLEKLPFEVVLLVGRVNFQRGFQANREYFCLGKLKLNFGNKVVGWCGGLGFSAPPHTPRALSPRGATPPLPFPKGSLTHTRAQTGARAHGSECRGKTPPPLHTGTTYDIQYMECRVSPLPSFRNTQTSRPRRGGGNYGDLCRWNLRNVVCAGDSDKH